MNIYVGNLSFQTTERQLQALFEVFGKVTSVTIVLDSLTRRSRGFGFIEMPERASAEKAIEKLHKTSLHLKSLVVNEVQPKGINRSRYNNRTY